MIIAIDFDGTIVSDDYPLVGEPIKGAKRYINRLHKDGHIIMIWTLRVGLPLRVALDYLMKNKIHFDFVNENIPEKIKHYNNDPRKLGADVFIDDRNIGGLKPWAENYKIIKKMEKGNV